ncbi:MAG: sugar ABC transporter permease [Candidatus Omnitrophica bacterium]|nr:sugar ABC transporter permease [Candidatus Omnitrophota bacterium]
MSSFTKPKFLYSRGFDTFKNFLFTLPAVSIFTIFYILPFYFIFNLSLHEWNGISTTKTFVGMDNFTELMGDEIWWKSILNAAYITLIALTLQNMVAFALALACDRDIRMKKFYRVVFFIPPVLSEVVVGLIWRWILDAGKQGGEYYGLLNYYLHKIGLVALVNDWLSDPETALSCIAVVHCWKGFGWGFIMLLAGLQTIDKQLYEAARVDGANSWQTFTNVTVPMMVPVILVVVILTVLGSMQVFVLVLSMVGQGLVYHTEVPVTRILSAMNGTKRFGYACAMGVNFGLILIMVSIFFKMISNRMKQA